MLYSEIIIKKKKKREDIKLYFEISLFLHADEMCL